jgi:hypothetical protein
MEKLFSGPVGLLLVIAQAGFFIYVMRGLFQAASGDDSIGRTFGAKRRTKQRPRARARGPEAGRRGAGGWSKTNHVLETHFDAVSGAMSGYVRTGPYAGLNLEDLTRTDCMRLHELCRVEDPDSAAFLETYMFRRFAGGGPRADAADRKRSPPPPPPAADDDGPMTRERAHAILGLQSGAEDAEIHRAHRALIKKHHPDHGGSHEKAALINQAKDMLLSKISH